LTCDHCDLQEVEKLTKTLSEKLTQASINRHPRSISERKINILKNDILASLQLLTEVATSTAKAAAASSNMTPYSFENTIEILDNFIVRSRTTFAMASSMLGSGDAVDNWHIRLQEVSKYFAEDERTELARLIIRKHDSHYNFHCDQRNCGPGCIFAVEQCIHKGCFVCYSRKYTQQHDCICPEKPLPCERTCGEIIVRKEMLHHVQDECILRPVRCPYECTGCHADLRFCDLSGHLQDATELHMEMMLQRMLEQQSVISSLHQQVQDLETARASQQATIHGLEVALAASAAALKISETRHEKAIRDEINRLEAKVGKTTSALGQDITQIRKNMMGGGVR
jgi:homogentisate solanesyltransferase